MTYRDIMLILKEIHDDCAERKVCNGCKYDTLYGCSLKHIPEEWTIELLYTYPEEWSGDDGE